MVSARLTVQGEMIGRNFPSPEVAERSLEQYSTAVLEHTLAPPPLPKAEFRAAMQEPMGERKRWVDQGTRALETKKRLEKMLENLMISFAMVHQNLENPK